IHVEDRFVAREREAGGGPAMARDARVLLAALAEDLRISIEAPDVEDAKGAFERSGRIHRELGDGVVALRRDPYRLGLVRDDHRARLHLDRQGHGRPDLTRSVERFALGERLATRLIERGRALQDLLALAGAEDGRVVAGLE